MAGIELGNLRAQVAFTPGLSVAPDSEPTGSVVLEHVLLTGGDRVALMFTPGGGPGGSPRNLYEEAARFWGHLFVAAVRIGRGESFGAHGALEVSRVQLLGLYRAAILPGSVNSGWDGFDGVESGALPALKEWLVSPLEPAAQWRCAHRLAAAFEGLMLPLCEQLDLAYPWELRNLAFRSIDRSRPGT